MAAPLADPPLSDLAPHLDEDTGGAPVRGVGLSLALGVVLFLVFDGLVFRSGWYARWAEPDSYFGRYRQLIEGIEELEAERAVFVLGDSRIAEGLSARIASEALGQRVINGSIPGSSPRVWSYLLRDLDPDRDRFALIVVPVLDYDGVSAEADPAARTLDLQYLAPRTPLRELPALVASFPDFAGRYAALRAGLLHGYALRRDVRGFLDNTSKRTKQVARAEAGGLAALDDYQGRSEDLLDWPVDWAAGVLLGDFDSFNLTKLLARQPREPYGPQEDDRRRWFGELVERYRGTGTRLVFLRVPRGPITRVWSAGAVADSAVRSLAREEHVVLLPEDAFSGLERPENYFDAIHLNARGRRLFSAQLAAALETWLR